MRSAAAASDRRRYRVRLPWRATRALIAPSRVGQPSTEHARAQRTADFGCGVCQLATRSSPALRPRPGRTATASGRRLRVRTVSITIFHSRGAWPARSSPRRESDDCPRRTRAHCAVRTWLWCGPTRDAFLPSSSAEPRPHGHRIRSAAAASKSMFYRVQLTWRAARALIAPSRIGRPSTEHAHALRGADFLVVWANSRRAPPQLIDRGSAARPPHQVDGCGFGPSALQYFTPVARGPRAHPPVENRTTAHGARARIARCGLGCGADQREACSSPAPWPRLGRTATASGWAAWASNRL